jgi:calcineurin-like phosphoesterase family protein
MDAVMIKNWNSTVNQHDEIYFLGDLRYGSSAASATDYLKYLNGRITFIKGNHDHDIEIMLDYAMVQFQGYRFLLIHNPEAWKDPFNGWIIHGQFHDNDLINTHS